MGRVVSKGILVVTKQGGISPAPYSISSLVLPDLLETVLDLNCSRPVRRRRNVETFHNFAKVIIEFSVQDAS